MDQIRVHRLGRRDIVRDITGEIYFGELILNYGYGDLEYSLFRTKKVELEEIFMAPGDH